MLNRYHDDDDLVSPETKRTMLATIDALYTMPILAQIQFVKHLIFDHGGDDGGIPYDPVMGMAVEALDGVMQAIKEDMGRKKERNKKRKKERKKQNRAAGPEPI